MNTSFLKLVYDISKRILKSVEKVFANNLKGALLMENETMSGKKAVEDAKEKKDLIDFLKEHKKSIVIGATTLCTLVAGVFILKNRKNIINAIGVKEIIDKSMEIYEDVVPVLPETIEASIDSDVPKKIINVREHLRNLPNNYNASQSKIDLAAQYGITLAEHQTWVNSYPKTVA